MYLLDESELEIRSPSVIVINVCKGCMNHVTEYYSHKEDANPMHFVVSAAWHFDTEHKSQNLQISSGRLVQFDTFKQRLEVSGPKALVVVALNDLYEHGWTVL